MVADAVGGVALHDVSALVTEPSPAVEEAGPAGHRLRDGSSLLLDREGQGNLEGGQGFGRLVVENGLGRSGGGEVDVGHGDRGYPGAPRAQG